MNNNISCNEFRALMNLLFIEGFDYNFINDTDANSKIYEVQIDFGGTWIAINNSPVEDDELDENDMKLRVMHIVPNKDIFLGREVISVIAEFKYAEDLLIYLKGMRRK